AARARRGRGAGSQEEVINDPRRPLPQRDQLQRIKSDWDGLNVRVWLALQDPSPCGDMHLIAGCSAIYLDLEAPASSGSRVELKILQRKRLKLADSPDRGIYLSH